MKKKILSLVLTLAMVLSLFSMMGTTASAATSYTVSVTTNKYYTLKNVGGGKYLNVYCNRSSNNTNITLWAWDGTSGENFKFVKSGSGYVLVPQCATSRAVNVYGDAPRAGANVCTWSKTGHSSQAWYVEYNESQKGFILRSAYNKNLALAANGSKNGSNVYVKSYNPKDRYQIWTSGALTAKAKSAASTLSISPGKYPTGTQNQGFYYTLTASVKSNYKLTAVKGEILNSSGKAVYSYTQNPNRTSFSVAGSTLDSKMAFNKLSAGKYSLRYTATDSSKTTKTWKSGTFTVAENKTSATMIWPLAGGSGYVSSPAGIYRWGEYHVGTDIAAGSGTKILALSSGSVKKVGCDNARGNYVVIAHGNYTVVYQHMKYWASVKAGASVKQGQVIGYVGSTGASTGAHLHLEIALTSSLSKRGTIENYLYNDVNTYRRWPTYYAVSKGSKSGSYYTLNLKKA